MQKKKTKGRASRRERSVPPPETQAGMKRGGMAKNIGRVRAIPTWGKGNGEASRGDRADHLSLFSHLHSRAPPFLTVE